MDADGAETDDSREEHFPSELLLTRRQYVRKPSSPAVAADVTRDDPKPSAQSSDTEHPSHESAPDKTSVFAHPVECFVSNFEDKELLKRMPLKIGEHTAPYGSFFKKIEYLTDNKGLIYWGKIKEIKDYTQSFRIDFEQKVWFKQADEAKKKPYSVNVYLSKKLIENYRKRKAFLEEIKHAIDSEAQLYCFFYDVTPELKQVPSKKTPSRRSGCSVRISRTWITSLFVRRRGWRRSDGVQFRHMLSITTTSKPDVHPRMDSIRNPPDPRRSQSNPHQRSHRQNRKRQQIHIADKPRPQIKFGKPRHRHVSHRPGQRHGQA